MNGKTYYGAGITDDKTVVTSTAAYALIQRELELASSIGADGATQATVGKAVVGTAADNMDGKMVFSIKKGSVKVREDIDFSLHVGADADMTNKIGVGIKALDTAGLGIRGLNVKIRQGRQLPTRSTPSRMRSRQCHHSVHCWGQSRTD